MKKEKSFGLYGIFGYPLGHTLSPAMQEAAFEAAGLKAFYLNLGMPLKEFREAMKGLRRGSFALDGFNLTVPYKEVVIPYLDYCVDGGYLGAVNTVFKDKDGKWAGANTDVYGFLAALKQDAGFDPKNKKALVLGAGGAARAAVYALLIKGAASVYIANRHPERAKKIVKDLCGCSPSARIKTGPLDKESLREVIAEVDLVVNATSVGLKQGEEILIPGSIVPKAGKKKIVFFDLIYHRDTRFLKTARQYGHRAVGGLSMLLFQGVQAFNFWTWAKKTPVAVMRKALMAGLEARH